MLPESNIAFMKSFITEKLFLIDKKVPSDPIATPQPEKQPVVLAKEPAAPQVKVRQGVLIILKQEFTHLEPSQRELLTKITAAVQVNIDEATIVSEAAFRTNTSRLDGYQHVLSFGIELPQATARYVLFKQGDQQFLSSDSLAALEQAVALKGKLWKAMQEMFLKA